MSRLGIRRKLFLLVIAAVAAALAGLVAGFNLLLAGDLSGNASSLVRARAAAEVGLLRAVKGRLVLGEAPDEAAPDTNVWVFAAGRTLEAPRTDPRVAAAARRLANGPERLLDVRQANVRLYAAPVLVGGRRLGTVVAGVSLDPYQETQRTALLASLALGLAVLLLVALAARWLLASSLRPVIRMTRQAAAWSEHDLDHRFGLGEPHDELTELAATLDALLDRLAASLRREQRFSAELSHELRTPLATLVAEAELALRRERGPGEYRAALELVLRNAHLLARTVDALVAAARYETGTAHGTADAFTVAGQAAASCAGLAGDRNLELDVVQPPHPIRLGIDRELATRILQPVVENACRYGRRHISISVQRTPGGVLYTVEDDGPGISEDERERIFEPGVRGQAGQSDGSGAGLGLALARRLARSASGDVEPTRRTDGGARFLIRLPTG